MDRLSADIAAEFPERGMQWVKDRVEMVVNETGEYVREKPTQSLLYAFAVGYVLESSAAGPSPWRISSPAHYGTKARDVDLWRRQIVPMAQEREAS